ncbi:hypothetical protein DPSP01_001085 [Paraphaeosphaeria sporulosa]|uniref:Uncharacterized protein n=1 Tax=Paraphaeosphaeria sporulosa TaxID=1460663 RepID=A0A177C5T8_9PLEO|nr:uncharacterized protein CC84DRAFT_1220414 [Paraphaeosphaeria sporulosa]OAG02050.1 hypothetical protein CC84DRAFT_1220414 [Paraphaeosphaeria sporulosa]
MLRYFALMLVALAWCTLAIPLTDVTDPNLAPWNALGIGADDAANFAASGVSPMEGAQIIATEQALFNGTVAVALRKRPPLIEAAGTQLSNVPGAYSLAEAMGLGMSNAATADGTNLKMVIIVGWRRQHVGITWQKLSFLSFAPAYIDLSTRFRDVLWELCPKDAVGDGCSYLEEKKLENIYYNTGTSGAIRIKVASVEMPSNLRDFFVNTLWGVFKVITECDKNRYQLRGFGGGFEACREFANSADQIEVRLLNTRGPSDRVGIYKDPHLRVNIKWDAATTEGPFDCVGSQSSIWDQVRGKMVPELQKIDAYKNAPVDFDVLCVTQRVDGGCFTRDICKGDSRWDDKDGSCTWHDKCSTPGHCNFGF